MKLAWKKAWEKGTKNDTKRCKTIWYNFVKKCCGDNGVNKSKRKVCKWDWNVRYNLSSHNERKSWKKCDDKWSEKKEKKKAKKKAKSYDPPPEENGEKVEKTGRKKRRKSWKTCDTPL